MTSTSRKLSSRAGRARWYCLSMSALLLASCAVPEPVKRYSYLYCKARDADPIVHQTVDSLIPYVGGLVNVAVGEGCVVIESASATPPAVSTLPVGAVVTVPSAVSQGANPVPLEPAVVKTGGP